MKSARLDYTGSLLRSGVKTKAAPAVGDGFLWSIGDVG